MGVVRLGLLGAADGALGVLVAAGEVGDLARVEAGGAGQGGDDDVALGVCRVGGHALDAVARRQKRVEACGRATAKRTLHWTTCACLGSGWGARERGTRPGQ